MLRSHHVAQCSPVIVVAHNSGGLHTLKCNAEDPEIAAEALEEAVKSPTYRVPGVPVVYLDDLFMCVYQQTEPRVVQ